MADFYNFIPLIVGGVFFALGLNIVLYVLRFCRKSTRIYGRVSAIERYVSVQRTNGHRIHQVFYRPIVIYVYNGNEKQVKGMGCNEIRHKLEQTIPVLLNISENGNEVRAMVDDTLSIFVGGCFSFMGVVSLLVYVLVANGSWLAMLVITSILSGFGYVIASKLLNFKSGLVDIKDLPEEDTEAILINTHKAYRKEVSSHGFWGEVIAFSFMLFSLGILYSGYSRLPSATRKIMVEDLPLFWEKLTSGEKLASVEQWGICGIGLFFFLASLRSVYYVRKKYGALLTR